MSFSSFHTSSIILIIIIMTAAAITFWNRRHGFGGFVYLASYVIMFGMGLMGVALLLSNYVTTAAAAITMLVAGVGCVIFSFGILNLLAVEYTCRPPCNNAAAFSRAWNKTKYAKKSSSSSKSPPPILACIGDSITHGGATANYVNRIKPLLFQSLGKIQNININNPLSDPLWVMNVAQNFLCSWTVYQERLPEVIACHPDWVLIMIGSNDVRAMYKKEYSQGYEATWNLPTPPNWEDYRTQLEGILVCLTEQSASNSKTKLQIGLCTLPPMGEDLDHVANQMVRKANVMIHELAAKHDNCTIVPVFETLEKSIRQKQKQQQVVNHNNNNKSKPPPDMEEAITMLMWMAPLHYLGCSWNWLSKLAGNHIMSDSLHLNEEAGDMVANLIVKWLIATKIQARMEPIS